MITATGNCFISALENCSRNRIAETRAACRIAPMNRPLLTQAARPLTFSIDAINENGESVPTAIAGEHPLTIYVDKR